MGKSKGGAGRIVIWALVVVLIVVILMLFQVVMDTVGG